MTPTRGKDIMNERRELVNDLLRLRVWVVSDELAPAYFDI